MRGEQLKPGDLVHPVGDPDEPDGTIQLYMYRDLWPTTNSNAFSRRVAWIAVPSSVGLVIETHPSRYVRIISSDGQMGWLFDSRLEKIS